MRKKNFISDNFIRYISKTLGVSQISSKAKDFVRNKVRRYINIGTLKTFKRINKNNARLKNKRKTVTEKDLKATFRR